MALDAFSCGGAAGSLAVLVSQPFDVLRIRMQTTSRQLVSCWSRSSSSGVLSCALAVLQNEGTRGLYRGVASPVVMAGTRNACILFGYDSSLKILGKTNLSSHALAGIAGGLLAVPVTTSSELVKVRAQVRPAVSPGLAATEFKILREICKQDGLRGFTCGANLTLARDCIYRGIYFPLYESLVRAWMGTSTGKRPAHVSLIAGGLAGMVPWTITYPIDVLKTHWQSGKRYGANTMMGMLRCGLQVEGPQWFCRGLAPTLLRACVMNATAWTTYEQLRAL
mmetsp:Transcript_141426/g.257051  ORF Transcript_141426/g.257051 Transcript_141426/m.257051 type:complete len:280 (-) Transcript_141426:130-969(-)